MISGTSTVVLVAVVMLLTLLGTVGPVVGHTFIVLQGAL